jgi:hypothetical protein
MRIAFRSSVFALLAFGFATPAHASVSDEFAVSPDPVPAPQWWSFSGNQSPPVLATPSGNVVVVGGNRVDVFDPSTSPPTLLATHTRPQPSALAYGTGPCGTKECLVYLNVTGGILTAQRLELDTLSWVDTTAIGLTDVLNDTPDQATNSNAIVYNGSSYLACWIETKSTSSKLLKCKAFDTSFKSLGDEVVISTVAAGLPSLTAQNDTFAVTYTTTTKSGTPSGAPCDAPDTGYDLQTAVLDASTGALVGTPTRLGRSVFATLEYNVAVREGDGFLALWGGRTGEICASRVDQNGGSTESFNSSAVGTFTITAVSVGSRGTAVSLHANNSNVGFELPKSGTTFEVHNELPNTLYLGLGDGSLLGVQSSTTTTDLERYNYDAGSSAYVGADYMASAFTYQARTLSALAFDASTSTFLAGWLDSGTGSAEPGAMPVAAAPGNGPLDPGYSFQVNLYAPGSAKPKKHSPVVIQPTGDLQFYSSTPVMDATSGVGLVVYLAAKQGGGTVLVGQRFDVTGTLLDPDPVALVNSTDVGGMVIAHSDATFYVSYSKDGTTWSTLSIDPGADSLTATAVAAGSPIPYGWSVGSKIAAVVHKSGSIDSYVLADADTLGGVTAIDAKQFNPPATKDSSQPVPVLLPGGDAFIETYEADNVGYSCAALNTKGTATGTATCKDMPHNLAPLPVLGSLGLGSASLEMLGYSATDGNLVYSVAATSKAPPAVNVFADSGETTDTQSFPADQRKITQSKIALQGGNGNVLAVYAAQWQSNTGETASNLYARWIDLSAPSTGTSGGSSSGGTGGTGGSNAASGGTSTGSGAHNGTGASAEAGAAGQAGGVGEAGASTGGSSGTESAGGSGGTTGSSGKAGMSGKAGTSVAGGTSRSGGGTAPSKSSGGCSLSVPASSQSGSLGALGIALGLLIRRQRRVRVRSR